MWALLSSWFRRLLFFTIVVPLIGWAIGKVADRLEERRGESAVTRGMRKSRDYIDSRRRRFP